MLIRPEERAAALLYFEKDRCAPDLKDYWLPGQRRGRTKAKPPQPQGWILLKLLLVPHPTETHYLKQHLIFQKSHREHKSLSYFLSFYIFMKSLSVCSFNNTF